MGGEKDDIDDFDVEGLDDGSSYDPTAPAPAAELPDDEVEDAPVAEEAVEEDAPEEAAEEEVEAEEEPTGEDDAEEEADPKSKGIPKYRFDEVNERRKTAEAELEQLRAQLEASKPPEEKEEPFDFNSAEKEYMDLLLDGDVDAALGKRMEIDAAKEARWKYEATQETRQGINAEEEQEELMALGTEAEAMFDVFNPDTQAYDQDKLDKVMVFMAGYEQRGMRRADAFVAALADAVDLFGLQLEDDAPAAKAAPQKKTDPKKAGLREQAHQPVGKDGAGSADAGAVVPNIFDLSDEEIDALPEKALARMRGDYI